MDAARRACEVLRGLDEGGNALPCCYYENGFDEGRREQPFSFRYYPKIFIDLQAPRGLSYCYGHD